MTTSDTRLLPRSRPAAAGLDPKAVRQLVDRFDELDAIHSFMLLRHGSVVAEGSWAPHTPERAHSLFSVSKSFTATAVGIAIDEGLFGLEDRVVDLLAADAPASPSDNLAAMRVRHLLTMTAGHAADPLASIEPEGADVGRQILAMPVEHAPGTTFVYNTAATYLAGLIVQRLTGQRLLDYLRPRLFDPLGITTAAWEQDADGYDVAGFGLSLTIEELAAFGQLYLRRGQWQGRQLVPAAWVDAATAAQVDNRPNVAPDWEQGYGYQFWRCQHGGYRADGAFGQFAIVWPEHEIVLAITSGIRDMQSVLDAVWETLLPRLTADRTGVGAEADEPIDTPGLRRPTPGGAPTSSREHSILGVRHTLQPSLPVTSRPGQLRGDISAITLSRDTHGLRLEASIDDRDHSIALGYGEWAAGTWPLGTETADIAAAAAWTDDSTLVARVIALGTPFVTTLTLRLADNGIDVSSDVNVSFDDTHLGAAVGVPAA